MPPRKLDESPKKGGTKACGRPNKAKRILKTPSIVQLKLKLPNATAADQSVGSEVNKVLGVEEANKPVTKSKTIAKKKHIKKKIVSKEQNVTKKGAPVKKKVQAKGIAKPEEILETKCASQDNTECNISKINQDYYKILLANQVVHAQFSKKPKYINEQPIDQSLKENKTTVKNNSNHVLKKKVATKKPVKTKKSGQTNRVNKGKACNKCNCIQSKEVENNTDNSKNTELSTKPKKLTKRVRKITTSTKSCKPDPNPKEGPNNTENTVTIDTKTVVQSAKRKSKLSLKRKTEKAGPERQNILNGVQKKARKMIDSRKLIRNELKDQKMTNDTDKSIENVNIDKNVDNNIEQASLASSSKSWTRNISTSSNSSLITVYSNGLHCFDNKIPVVPLKNINKKMIKKEKPVDKTDASLGLKRRLSRTSSSSSDQTKFNSKHNRIDNNSEVTDFADVTCSPLRLSTSSTSSSSSSSSTSSSSSSSESQDTRQNVNSELKEVFQKLSSVLKNCDFNKIKLSKNAYQIANESSFMTNVAMIRDKILKNDVLKEETELCCFCESIAKLEIEDVDKYFNQSEVQNTTEITGPKTPETFYSQDSQITNEHVNISKPCKQNTSNSHQCSPAKKLDAEIEEKIDGKYNKSNTSFVDNDDDDALSLFAESLTGLETCRRSSTFNSEISKSEEYVPQPVTQPRTQINYQPTKISNYIQYEDLDFTSLDKKQIEDPTPSLLDQTKGYELNSQENGMIYEDRTGSFTEDISFTEDLPISKNIVNKVTQETNRPRLMALNHRPANGLKSSIFKGHCFFHIISICKKFDKCNFIHVVPAVSDVKDTLERLSEDSFIQEYMLVRNFPQLRRKYGLCFMEECIRRDLTRILVEIAIDFVVKCGPNSAEDNVLKSEIVDNVLMYLNNVDLSVCDDLLRYVIKYKDRVLLCDYFMSVIAMSQNFSRFKAVFVNLTNFMYQNERKFRVDVAESILERLCILPYDDLLARAFLSILKKTDITVFSNAKMPDLERLLQASNINLYHELKLLKDKALVSQPVLDNHHMYEPLQNMENGRVNNNFGHAARKLITYSPDSINLSNASKSPSETVFKRTVNTEKLQQLGSGSKSNTQDIGKPSMIWKKPDVLRIGKNDNINRKPTEKVAKQFFKSWENRSIFDNLRNIPNASVPCRQQQPFKRHSDWSFEGSPTKFKRKGGPSYFQRDL